MASFTDQLRAIAKKRKQEVDQVARGAMLQLASAIVEASPVGQPSEWKGVAPAGYVGGRFRANWLFSVGSMDSSTSDKTDYESAFNIAKSQISNMPVGSVAYFTNSLPYAKRIEYDAWSQQAPAGVVRVNAISFSSAVEAEARRLR